MMPPGGGLLEKHWNSRLKPLHGILRIPENLYCFLNFVEGGKILLHILSD
jgi:hypothetical protein